MSEKRACPDCGATLPAGAPEGPCPRCSTGSGELETRPSLAPKGGPTVDLDAFRRSVLEIGLADSETLGRLAEESGGDVSRLARSLVKAGKITEYQATALSKGKAKGLVIGHYVVLDKCGEGGMGVVFKARHRESGRVVALKILLPSFGRDRDAVLRFRREFEVAARLHHPNVVAALEASEDRGVQFLTMEYVEGHDLEDMVRTVGPLPIKMSLHCAIQAAKGLAAAHERGIVHRDVKPANLMLDGHGVVRVLDLGLARVIESANATAGVAGAGLTQTGVYLGTVDYVAPEQADDPKKADHRADVYSLGCTLYFLLTGHPPFREETILKRLTAHQTRPAPSIQDTRDDVPDHLEQIYQEMMAKKPADRPGSMAEVVARLEACRASADEAKEARDGLMSFARTVMKRASPRKRERNYEASVFGRRDELGELVFDPDLHLEDLVMDYREEVKVAPLTEDQLPPVLPRVHPSRERPSRTHAVGMLGVGGVLAACVMGFVLTRKGKLDAGPAAPPDIDRKPAPAPIAPVTPGFQALFNGKNLAGWSPIEEGGGRWRVEDAALVVDGGGKPFRGILTDRAFGSFHLKVEFRAPGGATGGIYLIHPENPGKDAFCQEFNIHDANDSNIRTGTVTKFVNGSNYVKFPKAIELKPGDEWNEMEVVIKDGQQTVSVNGRGLEYPMKLDTLSGRHRIGLQDFKGTIRFRRVEIQELGSEPETGPSEVSRPGVLFADDFKAPRGYWSDTTPEQLAKNPDIRWGYREGIFFEEVTNGRHVYFRNFPYGPYSDFSFEVVGRITGDKPTSKGSVLIHLFHQGRAIQVRIDGMGALYVEPGPNNQKEFASNPWIGPIFHPAIQKGAAGYNTIRLLVRKRELEIFVNSTRVINPLKFDWDLTPATPGLGVNGKVPTVRAEYDRVEIKALGDESPGLVESSGDLAKPVRVADRGGVVMPDGTWIFEGAQLKIASVTGGDPHIQEDMDQFPAGLWSGHRQLYWPNPKVGDTLSLEIPVETPGNYDIRGRFTRSFDYGRCKLELDGKPLNAGAPMDFYNKDVVASDLLHLGRVSIAGNVAILKVTAVGKSRLSPRCGFGLDEVRLVPVR